jgi:hypothetical protein
MALQGKIDDFGIADIFQLIGQQQRSGILTMNSGNKTAEILFANGMISRANPLYLSPGRDPFGQCMIKAKLITEQSLQRALKTQDESLESLESVLLELRLLRQDQLQTVHDTLLLETLYDVLQWKRGDYDFTVKEVSHDERFGTLMSIEHILLDLLRMIDEEPDLARRIPHHDIILQREFIDEEVMESLNIEEELGAYEDIVFNLIDGKHTVQDIIDQSLLGRYNTIKSAGNLLDAGYVKKISVDRIGAGRKVPQRNLSREIFYGVLPVVIIVFLLSLRLGILNPRSSDNGSRPSVNSAIAQSQHPKIRNALNVYLLEKGEYPGALDALVEARLISPKDLSFPSGAAYEYALLEDGTYRLQ